MKMGGSVQREIRRITLGICVILTVALTGCFSFPKAVIKFPSLPSSLTQRPNAHVIHHASDAPHIVSIDLPGGRSYLALVEECGISEKVSSKGTTRELLIGFDNIKIESHQEHTLAGHQVLESRASAQVDQLPVNLITFALRHDECVRDYVFWSPAEQPSESSAQYVALLESMLGEL